MYVPLGEGGEEEERRRPVAQRVAVSRWRGREGGLIRSLFIGPSAPEECLFVCVHDGGDKKLMHRH